MKPLILLLSESEELFDKSLWSHCSAMQGQHREWRRRAIQSGISKLVNVLNAPMAGEVHAKAAAALAVLADSNSRTKTKLQLSVA